MPGRRCGDCGQAIPDDYPAIPAVVGGQAFHQPEDCHEGGEA